MTSYINMILGFTGHRPKNLPGKYSARTRNALLATATHVIEQYQPTAVISGMALGWDNAIATSAIDLGVPLVAAVPFEGHELRWSQADQAHYSNLLSYATRVHIISDGGYSPQAMQLRNEWIVRNCDMLIALCNSDKGGTVNCINYALAQGTKSFNCWDTFMYFYSQV